MRSNPAGTGTGIISEIRPEPESNKIRPEPEFWLQVWYVFTQISICQNEVGKPPFVACISDVIPLLKKLHYEVNSVDSAGIGTLKSSVLSELQRYFDTMYGVKSSREYGIATSEI